MCGKDIIEFLKKCANAMRPKKIGSVLAGRKICLFFVSFLFVEKKVKQIIGA